MGSEMCIRDRLYIMRRVAFLRAYGNIATTMAPSRAAARSRTKVECWDWDSSSSLLLSSSSSIDTVRQTTTRFSTFKLNDDIPLHYRRIHLGNVHPKQQQQQRDRDELSSQRKKKTKTHERGGDNNNNDDNDEWGGSGIRIAYLLSKHLGLSRRQSERMILTERVTLFGKIITSPNFELYPSNKKYDDDDDDDDSSKAVKVDGKLIVGLDMTLKRMHAEQKLRQQQLQSQDELEYNTSNSAKTVAGKSAKKENNQLLHHEALYSNTRIWLANKLKGELITEVRE